MLKVACRAQSHLAKILNCRHHQIQALLQSPSRLQRNLWQSPHRQRQIHTPCALAISGKNGVEGNEAPQSKGANKREAAKLLELALRLVSLTSRQFPRVESVLPESINDAVLTAQRISKTTQARKRQVNLVAKLLRQLDIDSIQQIQAALSPGHKTADELRKDALAEKWMEGLLADDKAAMSEINCLPRHWFDGQLVRRLLRQFQQSESEEECSDDTISTQLQIKKKLKRELQVLAAQHLEHEAEETYELSEDQEELSTGSVDQ